MPETPTVPSRYLTFDRQAWAKLRDNTPLTLSEEDLRTLRGLNEALSLTEVEQIYLPMSRLLSLYVRATQELHRAAQSFLGDRTAKVPFIIGLAGSVAVGKSTTARILQALLSRWPGHPSIWSPPTASCSPTPSSRRAASCTAKAFPKATTAAAWCASSPT
jgi:type I pantothenate kinase